MGEARGRRDRVHEVQMVIDDYCKHYGPCLTQPKDYEQLGAANALPDLGAISQEEAIPSDH